MANGRLSPEMTDSGLDILTAGCTAMGSSSRTGSTVIADEYDGSLSDDAVENELEAE